jgi:hypothetical protein
MSSTYLWNVSEFLQQVEYREYFLRRAYLPQSWNNGIVEGWNSGDEFYLLGLLSQDGFCHEPNIVVS